VHDIEDLEGEMAMIIKLTERQLSVVLDGGRTLEGMDIEKRYFEPSDEPEPWNPSGRKKHGTS
jgi:hypothetical protein